MLLVQEPINPYDFDTTVKKLRAFFAQKGFIEVHTQSCLSILAACEDPRTIGMFMYAGNVWPLPQTGQMWLENVLLKNPEMPGLFCVSTSYREEPDPIPGRHDLVFPMFEFEMPGGVEKLMETERELLTALGIGKRDDDWVLEYRTAAKRFRVLELEAKHEEMLGKECGEVVSLTRFPQHTSPFWNMKKVDDCAEKVDVLLFGVETIGSAERSNDPEEMRHLFHTISDGIYANILFSKFGRERVLAELNAFLKLNFFQRCGGGIGITRMIRALKLAEQL